MKNLVPALVAILVVFAMPATAQDLSDVIGEGETLTARSVQLFAIITIISIAPGIAIMVTCFPFIVTVLAILRQAIGLQQSPPNMMMVSLALFLTYFVMEPVLTASYENGIKPLLSGEVEFQEAFELTMLPLRGFMSNRVDPQTFEDLAVLRGDLDLQVSISSAPLSVLVPSFMLSELERAFQVGFLVFLPFLIIDLVVAAVLMSMGMMMVPPAIVSLPFKLAFFVVADGWGLIAASLVRSYI